jgi:hypothetical protein
MSERPSGCRVGESSKDSNDNFSFPSSLTLVILETFYAGFTALAQVIGIGLSIWLVDRMGRRKLVLLSLSAVTCSLIGLYVHHKAFPFVALIISHLVDVFTCSVEDFRSTWPASRQNLSSRRLVLNARHVRPWCGVVSRRTVTTASRLTVAAFAEVTVRQAPKRALLTSTCVRFQRKSGFTTLVPTPLAGCPSFSWFPISSPLACKFIERRTVSSLYAALTSSATSPTCYAVVWAVSL